MIVLRKNKPSLYWLSENLKLDGKPVDPAVPQNFLTQRGCINNKTPRFLLYDSLDDAISVYGVGEKKLSGLTLGVYRPKGMYKENQLDPDLKDCPYRDILDGHEYWCCIPLVMEKIADIKVAEGKETRKFRYGLRNAKNSSVLSSPLYRYSWSEILPEWDKKGKTKKL